MPKFLTNINAISWYFLMPVLFIHFFVIAFPSILSLLLCLTDWNGFGKINYVGLENFEELFMLIKPVPWVFGYFLFM